MSTDTPTDDIRAAVLDRVREVARLIDALVAADVDGFGIDPDVFAETSPAPPDGLTGDESGDFRCDACGTGSSPTPGPIPSDPPSGR